MDSEKSNITEPSDYINDSANKTPHYLFRINETLFKAGIWSKTIDMNHAIKKLIETNRPIFQGLPVAFDGVVDEEAYTASAIRTVFLMKEVNGQEIEKKDGQIIVKQIEQDWDYTEWLNKQAHDDSEQFYKTWPNICLWTELLRNENTMYMDCMNAYGAFDSMHLRKNLAEIAVINVKKTPGKGSSDYEELRKAAEHPENAALIRSEIDILNPNLIICGGTFEFAKKIFQVQQEEIMGLRSGAFYFRKDDRVYLEFVHPMWFSVNRNILFAYAKEVFREVKPLLK